MTNNRCLFADIDRENPGRIRLAVTHGDGAPDEWRSLDPELALIQVLAFLRDMEDGDGVIHNTDLPQSFLEVLGSGAR